MGLTLSTPMEVVNTIDEVRITEIINSVENEFIVIKYKLISDGIVPTDEKVVVIQGKELVKALYSEQDVIMATGKTFEEASREILYGKVLDTLAG